MIIKIFDNQFPHTTTCNDLPSKHIEWYRGAGNTPTCFITDRSLGIAPMINCRTKVGWLIEPRGNNPLAYSGTHLKDFDYMLSFDRQFIDIDPKKILFYPFGCCWIPETDRGIHEKTKRLSMVCSGKAGTEGHKFRNKIYDTYSGAFDGYGHYKNPIKNKADALKDYMFSICVQSTKADDYFTEILTDCFMTGTIPIFWGTDNIGKYFNIDGIIRFNDATELKEILNSLSVELYNSKTDAIKENYEKTPMFFSPEDYIFEHYPFLFAGML